MIGCPSERFIRDPSPALVRVRPAPFGVRPPTLRAMGGRLPDVAVVRGFHPLTIGREALVKHLIVAASCGYWHRGVPTVGAGSDRRFPGRRRTCCAGGSRRLQRFFFLGQFITLAFKFRLLHGQFILLKLQAQFRFLRLQVRDFLLQGGVVIEEGTGFRGDWSRCRGRVAIC